MTTHTARNGYDTWVNSAAPSVNYGKGKWLRCNSGVAETLIFMHNPVPHEATVVSATLRLRGAGTSGDTYTVSVRRISAKWAESSIWWNNKPGATGATVSVTGTQTVDGQAWDFDVSALLQTMVNGAPNYGFWVTTTSSTERRFHSLDAQDFHPVLITEWADDPDAPTELVPAGGSSVSVSKPVVSFNFHDPNSSDLASLQVQVKASGAGWTAAGGFASPDFDSGEVGSTDPELDLATTAYSGTTNGDTKFWTARVKNVAGRWSLWADPVHWVRNTKASLTINNPAASPNDFVEDHTPEFFWTVIGTQLARRLFLYDMDFDGDTPIWDPGRQHTAADTATPPAGLIDDEDSTYRLVVRIFDDLNRDSTADDPVYIEAARSFTFQEDATIDPVTSLTAQQVASDQPHVRLTWNRATAPDGYTITRKIAGGRWKVVAHNRDPADLFVSGTSYTWVDRTAAPHLTYTWRVRPRVNGKAGPGPTVDLAYEVKNIWLADVDTGRLVPVISGDLGNINFAMPEISVVFRPVNGHAVVRFVQGQYGLEGHVEGPLISHAGHTSAFWDDNLQWMAARPANELRLTVGDQNLRVKIGNVERLPLEGGNAGDRMVKFDFWSLDGRR